VKTDQNWTELLEDKLNSNSLCPGIDHYEVINLGVHGYDIEYSAERFLRDGKKYIPDNILWFLKYDDINEINEIFFPLEKQTASEMGINNTMDNYYVSKSGVPYPSWQEAMKRFRSKYTYEQIISYENESIQTVRKEFPNKLMFFTFATSDAETKKAIQTFANDNPQSFYFEVNGLSENERFPDAHPNILGHQSISTDIYNYFKDHTSMLCSD
jgi:hypothetical protein